MRFLKHFENSPSAPDINTLRPLPYVINIHAIICAWTLHDARFPLYNDTAFQLGEVGMLKHMDVYAE